MAIPFAIASKKPTKLVKNICRVGEPDSDICRVSHIQEKTSDLLTALDVDLLRNI